MHWTTTISMAFKGHMKGEFIDEIQGYLCFIFKYIQLIETYVTHFRTQYNHNFPPFALINKKKINWFALRILCFSTIVMIITVACIGIIYFILFFFCSAPLIRIAVHNFNFHISFIRWTTNKRMNVQAKCEHSLCN